MLISKKIFISAQLNIERLTPLQYDGIMRAMENYAKHYHDSEVNSLSKESVSSMDEKFNCFIEDSANIERCDAECKDCENHKCVVKNLYKNVGARKYNTSRVEEEIISSTKEFARSNNVHFDEITESMILNAMREHAQQTTCNIDLNTVFAKKIILELDSYGRSVSEMEYGLPIDLDTDTFEQRRAKDMLKIVEDILNMRTS